MAAPSTLAVNQRVILTGFMVLLIALIRAGVGIAPACVDFIRRCR
jgi:hypothetical protein